MRAANYARYSTELQSATSIEDQVRICRRLIGERRWEPGEVFSDMGMSGATHLRPGFQAMLRAAQAGRFEVLVAESVDRLSRDQEHIAGLYKQLCYLGIPLVTVAEGEISELHIGLKGTMSALFLKDLAQKTRRGLEGGCAAASPRAASPMATGWSGPRLQMAASPPASARWSRTRPR